MLSAANNADVYTDFNGLAKLKSQAKKESPEALKEVAKQFESVFLSNVLKSMREAKLADGIMDSDQTKFYNDMYDQQLAVHLSGKPGVGLADLVVKQLSHEPADSEHLGLPDYLERSSSMPKINAERSDEDGVARIKAYFQNNRPLNEMAEIPFQSDRNQPIQSAEQFVRELHPYAEQAARELGVKPKVLLAQAALETGWGRSLIKNRDGSNSFNLFNIKADKSWQGKQAQVSTLEFEQGIAKKVNAGFRSYRSYQESFRDYVDFIKTNPRYALALRKAGNAHQYIRELQHAGYATDPNYADKVMNIYQSNTVSGFKPDAVIAMNR